MFGRAPQLFTRVKKQPSEVLPDAGPESPKSSSSGSSVSEPESPSTSIRVIQLDSMTSLVLKEEIQKPSILNSPPTIVYHEDRLEDAADAQDAKPHSRASLVASSSRPPIGLRTRSEPRLPSPARAAPTAGSNSGGDSRCRPNSFSSSLRVNFAPLPQTRSRSGSASYGVSARAAMLQATRERRSSNTESVVSGEPRLFLNAVKGHPSDLADQQALPEIPDEALELDDEDRYCLDDDEQGDFSHNAGLSLDKDKETTDAVDMISGSKLWAALQTNRARRSSATSSTYHSSGSASSSYDAPSAFG